MRTRICLILILINLWHLPLFSQRASGVTLVEEIRQESFDLAILEEEIDYYTNLISKKEQINRLYKQNRLSTIREMFERDLAELDQLFEQDAQEKAVEKIWELDHIYQNIETLDIKNYFPEQKMQYYEARIAVRNSEYEKARRILENNLANNLDPENRNSIVALLEEVYFKLERYEDIISIYPIYRGINSALQRWWLAQSLYNTGDLEKAVPVFRRLGSEPEYALRSRAMLALATYENGDIAQAITDFNSLKFRYSPDTPYFNFINLSLARLYSLNGNKQEAINLYDQYVQLEKIVDDEILYEIASIYKEAGEYNQAIKYFRQITEKPQKSRYYVTAKYLIAITEQDRGNYESGRNSLRSIIDNNNALMQALNKKYGLLDEYAGLLSSLINTSLSSERQRQIDQQLQTLEEQFFENRSEVENLSQGLDRENLIYLNQLEEEYFAYTVTQANFEAFMGYVQSPALRRLPAISNFQMTRQDSSIVYLQILDYMEKIPEKSTRNYETARFLAEQKVYQAFLRDAWYDVYHLTLNYNTPTVTRIADNADSLISESQLLITELEAEAFKKDNATNDKNTVDLKINQIKDNNKVLERMEKDIINGFAREITPILAAELEDFASSQNEIRYRYVEAITAMLENLSDENSMYQNTLLDILFRQTMLLDQEYNEFRENITHE
ncbi:MAG: tetratricopeptide repeat protein [Candidatus Cloacimonetes bacterium]|nr:tetratricopeptide repeat protein [Candidatus Cloacimonadota bacterium]